MRNSHSNPSPPGLFAVDSEVPSEVLDVLVYLADLVGESVDSAESSRDFAQLVLDHGQSAEDVVVTCDRLAYLRWDATAEYCAQVVGVPVERYGEGFKRSVAAPALNGVVLEFSNDCLRHLRALREFSLIHAEFGHALVDRSCDRAPIVRHVFLRAPPRC